MCSVHVWYCGDFVSTVSPSVGEHQYLYNRPIVPEEPKNTATDWSVWRYSQLATAINHLSLQCFFAKQYVCKMNCNTLWKIYSSRVESKAKHGYWSIAKTDFFTFILLKKSYQRTHTHLVRAVHLKHELFQVLLLSSSHAPAKSLLLGLKRRTDHVSVSPVDHLSLLIWKMNLVICFCLCDTMDPSLWEMSCHTVLLGEIKGEVSALCVPRLYAAAVSYM